MKHNGVADIAFMLSIVLYDYNEFMSNFLFIRLHNGLEIL